MHKLSKSKRHIRQAYLGLLSQLSFDQICVKDIIDKAEIGRSTFYTYYDSKYELAEEIEQELIDGFLAIMVRLRNAGRANYCQQLSENRNDFFVEYFNFIRDNQYAFHALLSANCTTGFSSRFSHAIAKTRLQTIQIWGQHNEASSRKSAVRHYREEVLTSLYVTLFTAWLDHNMDLSAEEMAKLLAAMWKALTSI